ncbi:hypothetical protein J2741_002016 [Methanolinea mesophila]|uniref:hypothetical protein n=1 Tax=Methanolinea mesophila TaxID=547055 RepID=UPI001AE4A452|nr:hypothetical protein [Methanolinea mesophila]MBP1929469.1 hypothetical protein [Methanolinea mesophila]
MKRTRTMAFGALLLVLVLLVAGCTQPSGAPTTTVTPTATATPQVTVPVTTPPADNETLKTEMMAMAETLATTIDKQNLSAALKEGENSTAFAAVLVQLQTFKADNPQVFYAYVLEQKNGTVVFIVTNYQGEPGAPLFMQEYLNPPEVLKTPVTGPIGIGPYTDEYGTFISGFAPVDTGSNTSVILAGVDYQV